MEAHAQQVIFSSAKKKKGDKKGKDNWRTPFNLFSVFHCVYQFTIDGAADATNHLLPRWYGPGSDIAIDALTYSWAGERVWLNPPYSLCKNFIAKAAEERYNGVTSVCLVPARTDTRWWHRYVWDTKLAKWREGVSGDFLKGRVKFIDPDNLSSKAGAPFPSAVIVFHGDVKTSGGLF